LNISACRQGSNALSPEEEAARHIEQLYQQHAQQAQQCMQQIVSNPQDSTYADRMATSHYRDGGEWHWMASPGDIEMCDALDSLIHSQATAMGFSESVFRLPAIDEPLQQMHQPDSVENLAETMAQLEADLTKAYLRYAIGQRFGFTTPVKLFGSHQYDIDTEQADSAFVHHAMQQLTDKQTMLNFLAEMEPQDSAYHMLKRQLKLDSTAEARQRTLCNMERLRWRDKKHAKMADRYIFVNIASQQVWAIAPDSVNNMRICCGKPATKTPLLSSEIQKIEVNPEWGIPQSIIRGEVSGHAGDSAYFARRNYYVVGAGGKRVNPGTLSRAELASGRYAVRQRSGSGNALGRIIFRFPNRFSVYLHDTSSPGAFNNDRRTISHGCVRLQRPIEIAEFVLPNADPWLLEQIRLSMDLQPKSERGREYRRTHSGAIRLINSTPVEPAVPVLVDYYTAYPNPKTGQLDIWGDPYGYDKIIFKAIKPYLSAQ
jgi:murein L,D-transpeptidase YcbB/YkuD